MKVALVITLREFHRRRFEKSVVFLSLFFCFLMNNSVVDVPVGERISPKIVDKAVICQEQSQQLSSPRYVTIFDFDDTLLPSSWLVHVLSTREELTEKMKTELRRVERSAYNLLSSAIQSSHVIIITNAEEGWVQSSCALFMPSVYSLLSKIVIVSARSRYECVYPTDSAKWKELTFYDEIESIRGKSGGFISLLSIGDSLLEREAVFSYGRSNNMVLAKSIKLIDVPTPAQLVTQQELICNALQSMILSSEKLDLKLSVKVSV